MYTTHHELARRPQGASSDMAARDHATRYRHRVSRRLCVRDTRRRVLRAPDVADPREDERYARGVFISGEFYPISKPTYPTRDDIIPIPDVRLRDPDSDPDHLSGEPADDDRQRDDEGGGCGGYAESFTARVWWGVETGGANSYAFKHYTIDTDRRSLPMAGADAIPIPNTFTVTDVRDPDTGDAVPTDLSPKGE